MIYFSWVTSLNGIFIFDIKENQFFGVWEKRRGEGDIFQFTELGGARCVEGLWETWPQMQCYIYPTETHPLPSPTPASSRNLSMYVAFWNIHQQELFHNPLERPVRPFLKIWTRFEKTAGQLLRKSAKSTEERVRSPIFVSSFLSDRRCKYPATPQKKSYFRKGEQSLRTMHRKGVRRRREEETLGRGDLLSQGSANREHRRKKA